LGDELRRVYEHLALALRHCHGVNQRVCPAGVDTLLVGESQDSEGSKTMILIGNCLDVLKTLDAESIQCCVTSPPYFGLRDYGIQPTIWGGTDDCVHDWQWATKRGISGGTASSKVHVKGEANFQVVPDSKYGVCLKCGAWLGCLGSEPTADLYVAHLALVFREVHRVLRSDGTLLLNLGYSFDGRGNCLDVPHLVKDALVRDGWYFKCPVVWEKVNPMPSSQTKRPTVSHEMIFMLAKDPGTNYHYDAESVREQYTDPLNRYGGDTKKLSDHLKDDSPYESAHREREMRPHPSGRTRRSVWTIPTQPTKDAHQATFPERLVEICILAGTSPKACEICGSAYERILEKQSYGKADSETRYDSSTQSGSLARSRQAYRAAGLEGPPEPVTLGFKPTCSCDSKGTGRSVVLDPFGGTGTTGRVAEQLCRDWVCIDLNPDYGKIARRKTAVTLGLAI
jgi:DNA modification methylase